MLRGFNDLAGLDALCAHFHPAVSAARKLDANGLQIRIEAAARFIVSV